MYFNLVFLDQLLFITQKHSEVHTDSDEYSIVAFSKKRNYKDDPFCSLI